MLDETTFQTSGNRIQIYDFVTSGGATTKHVDDLIGPELNSNSPLHTPEYTWPFVNGPHQWCPGEHKFFGWLAQDANMTASNTPETFFGSGFDFDEATHVLTIPQVTFTKDTPQFDFMYSDIFTTEPINTPVQLKFSHLFCAVSFGIVNDASSDVHISNFKVTLYTNKKATVDYSGSTVAVNYTNTASSPATFRTSSGGTLSGMSGGVSDMWVNAFAPTDTERQYILMWPQTKTELSACKINITYTLNNQGYNQSLAFPEMELNAGQKYHFDIFIADKAPIRINYLVVDWDSIDNEVTFE